MGSYDLSSGAILSWRRISHDDGAYPGDIFVDDFSIGEYFFHILGL
jgi:hypothetical protein